MTSPATPAGRRLLHEVCFYVREAEDYWAPVDPARVPDGPALDRAAAAGVDRSFLAVLVLRSRPARTGAVPHEVGLAAVEAVLAGVDPKQVERLSRRGLNPAAFMVLAPLVRRAPGRP